ncbi:aminoacetone oxidase family FAD-binding enzyme [Candidatus Parcubacteria bacterium]|nr:MAG: aminoacetone oxidase family FAD-binding enzyme [Candidatus Parcubacteria bacterium]
MKYDLVVIGGGPAGMMAAGRAGELGARVLLLEKNWRLGNKLLITGKGRCNITNDIENVRQMTEHFGVNGRFLFSALNNFGPEDIIEFFNNKGVKTKTERGLRVFPESDKSEDVLNALISYLENSSVEVRTNMEVETILKEGKKIEKIIMVNGEEIEAENFLIATGGKSYSETGSTGDAYKWLEDLGHKIVKPIPSLTPIRVREKIVRDLEGLSLKNVEISLYKDNKKIDSRFGEALFTRSGMSGPIILDMSKKIVEEGIEDIVMKIDYKPSLDFATLDKRIQEDFSESNNKMFKNSLANLLPQKLVPVIIDLSEIDPDKKVNSVSKAERSVLLHLLKEFKLHISDVVGFPKSIVTAGGVELSEVNSKTMKSRIIDNLYFAGEVLDLDGPTGGFNLQICWSTGFAAGSYLIN